MNMSLSENYICSIINSFAEFPEAFVESCTQAYIDCVRETAQRIFADKSKKIVTLAGPSSSGKTTTAAMLSKAIESLGARAYTVSLDDFYYSRSENKYPLDENGKPDYETVYALDLDRLHRCFGELSEKGESMFPVFDFMNGERIDGVRKIVLSENDIIIVEGLHALNPVITENLNSENIFKIYVSVSSRVYDDNGEVLLSKRNLRFIRRMVRDNLFRATEPEKTFELWKSVMRGEEKYLFPFEKYADVRLDSFHPCEPCIMASQAIPLLKTVRGEYAHEASVLAEKLSLFKNTDKSLLPEDSLLREFTGA